MYLSSAFRVGDVSNDSSKQLFLKGTGLKQLKEDYDNINKLISMTQTMLERKRLVTALNAFIFKKHAQMKQKQALPDLIAKVSELEQKWNDMEQARTLDSECDKLRDQLIWSNIQAMEAVRRFPILTNSYSLPKNRNSKNYEIDALNLKKRFKATTLPWATFV